MDEKDKAFIGHARGPSRILIAGRPRTGKTTLAIQIGETLGHRVRHADDLNKTHPWSEQSLEVAAWMEDRSQPWVIEGVTVVRAIRKWLERTEEKPADLVYWGSEPYIPLDAGQQKLGQGCLTIWNQIYARLIARGVQIQQMR